MAREEDVRKSLLKRLFCKASYKFGGGRGLKLAGSSVD